MSAKRLRLTGWVCIALSGLIAALGLLAQAVCIVLGIILFHAVVVIPLAIAGGSAGPAVLPIPRIWPASWVVAGLLLASGLACLLAARRRSPARSKSV